MKLFVLIILGLAAFGLINLWNWVVRKVWEVAEENGVVIVILLTLFLIIIVGGLFPEMLTEWEIVKFNL